MAHRITFLLLAAGLTAAIPLANVTVTVPAVTATTNACAAISILSASSLAQNPAEPTPTVPAAIAYECLMSVPFKVEPAHKLLSGLESVLEFQSTLDHLKDPQALDQNYEYPPIDLMNELSLMHAAIVNGTYTSEWQFQLEIKKLIGQAHDGHLSFSGNADLPLRFHRDVRVASVSRDGLELPKLYLVGSKGEEPLRLGTLAVTKISGIDSVDFLLADGWQARMRDKDADYNTNLFGHVLNSHFSSPAYYPGTETELEFEDGTTKTVANFASVERPFDNITSPDAFYEQYCTEDPPALQSASHDTVYDLPTVALLEGPGYEDVGVIGIPGFQAHERDFRDVLRSSLVKLRRAGRSKLIIDVQSNPGGYGSLLYEVFAQLFPRVHMSYASSYRVHEALIEIAQEASAIILKADNATAGQNAAINVTVKDERLAERVEILRTDIDHWDEIMETARQPNLRFSTTPARVDDIYSVSSHSHPEEGKFSENIAPIERPSDHMLTPAPYDPKDVVVLTNGMCSSACPVFVQLLKQAKVRSIALGGRPQNAPMQAMGGVKGGQLGMPHNAEFEMVLVGGVLYNDTLPLTTAFVDKYRGTALGRMIDSQGYLESRSAISYNAANSVREGDPDEIPLQFVYEAADCRLFYTKKMISNATSIWKAAANAMFYGGACVEGSTGHPSSRPWVIPSR